MSSFEARTLAWLVHQLLYAVQDILVAADANRTDQVRYWRFGAQTTFFAISSVIERLSLAAQEREDDNA